MTETPLPEIKLNLIQKDNPTQESSPRALIVCDDDVTVETHIDNVPLLHIPNIPNYIVKIGTDAANFNIDVDRRIQVAFVCLKNYPELADQFSYLVDAFVINLYKYQTLIKILNVPNALNIYFNALNINIYNVDDFIHLQSLLSKPFTWFDVITLAKITFKNFLIVDKNCQAKLFLFDQNIEILKFTLVNTFNLIYNGVVSKEHIRYTFNVNI